MLPEHFAKGAEYAAVAGVVVVLRVGTNAVDAYYIALVLYGAGLQQGFPGEAALLGPVGHVEEHIVFITQVSCPYGEAEVVADLQVYAPAVHLCYGAPFAAGVVLVFAAVSKEVPLIVDADVAIGLHPEHAVVVFSVFFYDETSGEDAAVFYGHIGHPAH